MIYVVVFALIFVSLHHLKYYRNTYTKCVSFFLSGLAVLLFFSLLQIIKTSAYRSTFDIDYRLFRLFSGINIYFFDICALVVCCFALVVFSIFCIGFFSVPVKHRAPVLVISAVPLILFSVLNSPRISYNIYLYLHSVAYPVETAERLIRYASCALLSLYLLSPYTILFRYYRKTDYYVKKRHYILTALTVFFAELILLFLFIFGPLYSIFITDTSFLKTANLPESANLSLLIIVCITLSVLIFVLLGLRKKPFAFIKRFTVPTIASGYSLNQNLRMTLHSYKNFFFAIEKLSGISQQYIAEGNNEKASQINAMIEKISHDTVTTLCGQLNMLRDLNLSLKITNLSDILKSAVQKAALTGDIELETVLAEESVYVLADAAQLTEALYNLIANAAAAVESVHRHGGGKIRLTLNSEDDWSCIEVYDNGCGIAPKNIRKVFHMLYSTKQTNGNFGVGLYYVRRVALGHKGYITVKSQLNEFTSFKLFLPTVIKK